MEEAKAVRELGRARRRAVGRDWLVVGLGGSWSRGSPQREAGELDADKRLLFWITAAARGARCAAPDGWSSKRSGVVLRCSNPLLASAWLVGA